jgi:hypothetical protein
MGNVQVHHNTDVPMATQRSDSWPLEEVVKNGEVKVLSGRQVGKYLQQLDKDRAKKNAEELLAK